MPDSSGQPAAPSLDQVQPFILEATGFRGRLLRLGAALDRIVTRHDYPRPVAALLAEMLALAALVSSLLKHDGIFTLQAQ
ncbi:MAG: Hsp33 family molecular chaperone HslO, partial [Pseudomonadales bacterium]|nr:Hsp33 family molecular chaperone HslO [Pseudomonadales bacterium]